MWAVLLASAFATGWLVQRWWSIAIVPAACAAFGIWSVASEPPNYDMHGFGYVWAAVLAVLALLAWLAGRALTAWHDPTGRRVA